MEDTLRSEIIGEGHGSAHIWVRGKTAQLFYFSTDQDPVLLCDHSSCKISSQYRHTHYNCSVCNIEFQHLYTKTSDIFKAMQDANIPLKCKKVYEGKYSVEM